MTLYACTSNPGKLREFILAAKEIPGGDVQVVPLPGLNTIAPPEEPGSSFEENARLKAIYYSRFTDEMVFADDSGLSVEALGGEPGIHSARYAGEQATAEENNALLLARMRRETNRSARFDCVIAVARAGSVVGTFSGEVEGELRNEPSGAEGFGYDPLFFYPPLGRTFGEIPDEAKFDVSARGRALRRMFQGLPRFR